MPASTRLQLADGSTASLGELVLSQATPLVWSLDEHWKLVPRRLLKAFPSGVKPVFSLRLASGRSVDATANHPFRTIDGWVRLDQLQAGDAIAVPRRLPNPVVESGPRPTWDEDELVLLAHLLGDGTMGPSVKYATADPANKQAVAVLDKPAPADPEVSDVFWDEIVEIVPLGEMPTFDATIEDTHNFIADGVIAHNSLEQDADVVMFLYRDEIYNAESPDRGTAEVIVSKHRSGPTGVANLAFLGQYTRFANMARV